MIVVHLQTQMFMLICFILVEQIKKTCETVASFLLFHPDDKTMLSNKNYYLKKSGVPEDWFVPRKVIFFFLSIHLVLSLWLFQ